MDQEQNPADDDHSTREQKEDTSKNMGFSPTSDESERTTSIRIKNRRKVYLDRHPSYFESHELEFADLLLYDRCVRRFQSAAEREADGRSKGYSGVLEADLFRSEAKLAALKGQNDLPDYLIIPSGHVTYVRSPDGEVLPEDPDEIPMDKDEGLKRWKHEMTIRFLKGEDIEFSYKEVDENDELDIIERMEVEDQWFDDEEPQWIDGQGNRQGETGIQDF